MINPYDNIDGGAPVSDTMRLVLRVSQALGVAPVQFQETQYGWRVSISRRIFIVHSIFMTVFNIAAISGFLIDWCWRTPSDLSVRLNAPVTRFAWITDITTSLMLASTATYGGHSRLKEIIKCLRQCEKMKYTLGVETKKYSEERRKTGIFLITIFIVLALLFLDFYILIRLVLDTRKNLAVAIFYSSYELGYIMAVLLDMQFVFSAFEIHSVLNSLNKVLKHILVFRKTQDLGPTCHLSKRVPEAIQQLAAMYDEICTQVWKLGEANNMALAMLLGMFILRIVITSYNFISNVGRNLSLWVSVLPLWCFVHFFCILIMVEPPHLTKVEMERTSFLICRLENKFSDLEVSYELAKFSLYAALNKVCYSPLGVCKLSRSLLYSILGILTTYIIIILQFQSFGVTNN